MSTFWRIADASIGIIVGGPLAILAIVVGVIGLALWSGWSRNRDLERRGWKHVSRW